MTFTLLIFASVKRRWCPLLTVKLLSRRCSVLVSGCVFGAECCGVGAVGLRPVKVFGLVQSANGSGVDPALDLGGVGGRVPPLKVKVASLTVMVPLGPESIVVSAAVVSTVKVRVAGVVILVSGCVAGPDLESVRAVGKGGDCLGARAGREGIGIYPAFEVRAGLGRKRIRSPRSSRRWVPDGPEVDRGLGCGGFKRPEFVAAGAVIGTEVERVADLGRIRGRAACGLISLTRVTARGAVGLPELVAVGAVWP